MKRILVPTDGSECANKAVDKAIELTKIYKNELIFLYVDEGPDKNSYVTSGHAGMAGVTSGSPGVSTGGINTTGAFHVSESDQKKETSDKAEKILSTAKSKTTSLSTTVTALSIRGHAEDVIPSFVKNSDIDLVVMGSSSKTGLKRFFMGTVAEKVAKSIEVSILIVR